MVANTYNSSIQKQEAGSHVWGSLSYYLRGWKGGGKEKEEENKEEERMKEEEEEEGGKGQPKSSLSQEASGLPT